MCPGTGLAWSDFTGEQHAATHRRTEGGWVKNTRGGDSGFIADISDTARFCATFNISGFFRGHQDEKCSFKLVGKGQPYVVSWAQVLDSTLHSTASLARDGFEVKELMQVQSQAAVAAAADGGECCPYFPPRAEKPWTNSAPVFTMSTCAEARGLLDEGFLHVTVGKSWDDWVLRPHIYACTPPVLQPLPSLLKTY